MCQGVFLQPQFSRNFTYRKCEGTNGEAVRQEGKSCDEVETVQEFTSGGDRVSSDGKFEATVAAKVRCGWVKRRKHRKSLHRKRFPLQPKRVIYKSYARQAILYESAA